MRIRSITCFFDPRQRAAQTTIQRLGQCASAARTMFSRSGLEVQSTRLATVPFPYLYPMDEVHSAVQMAQTLEADAAEEGFGYVSIGPALPQTPSSYELVLPMLAATKNVFISGMMTTRSGANDPVISLAAVKACARIITGAAGLEPGGFANLRFGALANIGPFGPFLPGAYHQGERPAFALAIECADVVYSAIRKAKTLAEARENIISALEAQATALASGANHLAQQFDMDFRGFDFSPAPYPAEWCSLGAALEALGLPELGFSGSLAAAAFLADTLDRGAWLRTGFNGMMMPVLEDTRLAQRTAGAHFKIHDLLMYSAVCGTGLDTVPLPGDSTADQISAILLDVAALALRLDKPLLARLMPVPGKHAGDTTEFEFEYFANGKVMELPAAPLHGLLAGEEMVSIRSRGRG